MKLNFKCLNCDFSSSIVNFEIVGYSLENAIQYDGMSDM